jgi:cation diffusion facilitator family transporter
LKIVDNTPKVRQITWIGIAVNLVLSIVKVLAGVFGMSKALIADGLESGMDILTSLGLVVGSKYWSAPPDKEHPYGHRRIETIITIGIGLVVGAVGGSIIANALSALRTGEHTHPTLLAFSVAVISVIGKEILFQWSVREGRKIKSPAVVANAWHHRSDAISSVPVVFAVGFAQFFPEWTFLDALGALIAAVFILKASMDIIRPALREIADTGASEEALERIRTTATSVDGVNSIHDLRSRYVGSSIYVDLHIVVNPDITVMAGHLIGDAVTARILADVPDVLEVLVHIDPAPNM